MMTGLVVYAELSGVFPTCLTKNYSMLEVAKASEMDGKGKHLLLHCNYKNALH
jgi:hypothetical protein